MRVIKINDHWFVVNEYDQPISCGYQRKDQAYGRMRSMRDWR